MQVNGLQLCIGCMHTLTNIKECSHCGMIQTEYAPLPRCLVPGTKLANRYVLGKVLGEGSFGITYIGWDEIRNIPVAIKEYYPADLVSRDVLRSKDKKVYAFEKDDASDYETQLQKFYEEAQNLSRFNQLTSIVSVYDFFYENQTAYIVMNYIEGISLKEYIKQNGPMTQGKMLQLMEPVLMDMQKVHESGLIHRDISPSNILMDADGKLILIDFGAARITNVDLTRSLTLVFKRGYSPEEQYRSDGKQGFYTDIYSLSAVMYYMLTGKTPLEAVSRMIDDTMASLSEMKEISLDKHIASAIMKGLSIKAENRWQSCEELFEAIYQNNYRESPNYRKSICVASIIIIVGIIIIYFSNTGINQKRKPSDLNSESVLEDVTTEMKEMVGTESEQNDTQVLTTTEFVTTELENTTETITTAVSTTRKVIVNENSEEPIQQTTQQPISNKPTVPVGEDEFNGIIE